ncbi:MAG: hypothetical protein A2X18_00580 [Bacteroidetes bacterium GWF2_40_14]|nr:MAG: hypothetical protein A2X18_00580 [Bacteroidetes bacterium GWF2_40_14]
MIKLRKLKISYERGRQVLLFLFCLFLAFIIWSIHKLSADYSTYLTYRVHVSTNLQGRASDAISNNLLTLKGRSSGFYILQQRYFKGEESIYIQVNRRLLKANPSDADGYYVLSSDVKDKLGESFGENLTIENFSVDTLFFNFPRQINKKVTVAPKYVASYKSQHMATGKIKFNPDVITIYGDYSLIDKIDSIYTIPQRFQNLEESINGVVDLEEIPGIRLSQKEVYYTLEVERYIEKNITVRIRAINTPGDKEIGLFPEEVKMTYRVPLSYSQIIEKEKFVAIIDYNEVLNSINSFVEPKLSERPSEILSLDFEPKFVECRIIQRIK